MLRRMLAASLLSCAISMAQDNATGTSGGGQQQQSPTANIERAAAMLYPVSRTSVISGRVLAGDGATPSERVRVQRVCGASLQETYTDSQGRFSLSIGGSSGTSVDASVKDTPRGGNGGGGGRGSGILEANPWSCELHASLRGYRQESVPIGVRHQEESLDVGTIILHPVSNSQGMTMSATTGLAPKEAQKSYERGLVAIRHAQPDAAQKEFTHAVGIFSRFAAAWFELGKVFEQRGHRSEARNAYAKAIAADGDFLNPIERLYLMDTGELKWQEAADGSSRVMHRDPYEFPSAYYVNALANLQLQNLDAAERSAREAGRLKGGDTMEPRASYVLGLVLARQGHLAEAADSLRAFLSASLGGAEQRDAERILANIETRMRNRAAREAQKAQAQK